MNRLDELRRRHAAAERKERQQREEQQYEAKLAALRRAIDEGDASGVAAGNVFARVRKTLALPRPSG